MRMLDVYCIRTVYKVLGSWFGLELSKVLDFLGVIVEMYFYNVADSFSMSMSYVGGFCPTEPGFHQVQLLFSKRFFQVAIQKFRIDMES